MIDKTSCNCSCGQDNFSDELREILEKVRKDYGKSVLFNSACRCHKYNKSVGGVASSAHISTDIQECRAVDIRVDNSTERFQLVKILIKHGIKRLGLGNSFIHADVDKSKVQEVIWLY